MRKEIGQTIKTLTYNLAVSDCLLCLCAVGTVVVTATNSQDPIPFKCWDLTRALPVYNHGNGCETVTFPRKAKCAVQVDLQEPNLKSTTSPVPSQPSSFLHTTTITTSRTHHRTRQSQHDQRILNLLRFFRLQLQLRQQRKLHLHQLWNEQSGTQHCPPTLGN